jgi:hypothetical protein
LAVKPRRPFSTAVGVFIVVLAVLGSAHSFFWQGGVRFYADRPLRILLVVGSSAVFTMVIWLAARRFPRFSPLLHALGLVVIALGLSAGAVVAAYSTARIWGDEAMLGSFRWVGVGFAAALGGLAVESWRECCATWKVFLHLGQNGQPDTAANTAPPGRFV